MIPQFEVFTRGYFRGATKTITCTQTPNSLLIFCKKSHITTLWNPKIYFFVYNPRNTSKKKKKFNIYFPALNWGIYKGTQPCVLNWGVPNRKFEKNKFSQKMFKICLAKCKYLYFLYNSLYFFHLFVVGSVHRVFFA